MDAGARRICRCYLETAGRSISDYLVDDVDDSSSRPLVADALSWCSTNQPARTRLPAARWRVVHWTAGGAPPGPCQSRGMGSAAGHAGQGCGELWREVMLVAGTTAVLSVVSRSSAGAADRAGSGRPASWILLGEHGSRGPC
jgi:hypothetical protein